ncbi:hypothetical protein BK126_25425 [Paenibacillus sp. FSL H7-0326]|nr:hypothetical protein BK126_25425 [Paenibacillus sp. FSL H7-0326]
MVRGLKIYCLHMAAHFSRNFNIPGDTQDVVVTTLSGAIGGDSGGLVYSIANNGTKNYARIEGVYAGSLLQNGIEESSWSNDRQLCSLMDRLTKIFWVKQARVSHIKKLAEDIKFSLGISFLD